MTIYTRGDGTPIEKPEPPGEDADIESKIAWIRAFHAYNDEIADVANRAFADGFRKALK